MANSRQYMTLASGVTAGPVTPSVWYDGNACWFAGDFQGNVTPGTTKFLGTIPSSVWPESTVNFFYVFPGDWGSYRVKIQTNGQVYVTNDSQTYLSPFYAGVSYLKKY